MSSLSITEISRLYYEPLEDVILKSAIQDYCAGGESSNAMIQKYGHMEDWYMSHITDLGRIFGDVKNGLIENCKAEFHISNWDVSNVKLMGSMFISAYTFNGDLSKWDIICN